MKTKKPFFAKFLTSQVEEKQIKAGATGKYPSDSDEGGGPIYTTMKYPSDRDEGPIFVTQKYPSDNDEI